MGNSNASRRQRALVAIGLAVMTMSLAVLATGAKGCDESDGKGSAAGSALTVLSVTTSQLPVARLEQPWAGVLEAAGGTAPYQWSVATLPGWMQLDASQGVLWGMVPASAAGSPVISVTVTDAVNDTATRDLTLVYTSLPAAQLPISLVSVADHSDGHFRTHTVCANCHSNAGGASAMRDSMNRDLGPVNLWRGTMMANSFRDPYFRAVLAAEKEHHPNLAATIEDTCLTCHAPQAAYEAHQQGGTQTLSELYTGATSRAQIGLDGVSCSTCHQIEATGLGTPATYTAKFQIAPSKVAYARHANPFANPMVNNSGYTPTQASHTSQSKMCASCHTLHTPVVDLANNLTTATFPEQAPYYEWRNSIYSTEVASPGASAQDCQGCHMPSLSQDGVAINTRIARRPAGDDFPPISPRQPFSRHSMLGANTIMLSILRDHAGDLNSPASTAEFNHLIDRNRDFLRNSTGDVTVQNLALNSGTLSFDVKVENHTGHKFPTSYLSRRAWLRVLVKDAGGNTVWRSGDY
ncbi:MAG: ammonia-forming cytochrome c nitrite reductase subunit c552, partial [Planctomycetes bacterium]|nr:ammonia-forming cytochrome c nitrite reductase subunit c552 [Planctomycetota bacterium]